MKNFCRIVCLRLAIFPLFFNLSFAQEVEVGSGDDEEISQISPDPSLSRGEQNLSSFPLDKGDTALAEGIWDVDNEVVEDLDSSLRSEWQIWSQVDSSSLAPQNDSLMSSWTEWNESEGSYVWNEWDTQDSSLRSEWQEDETWMDSSLCSEWQEDDELEIQWNDENEDIDDEDDDEDLVPELIISEVYYDGKDEWIEIFNIWNGDFLWDIELSWAILFQ